MNARAYLDWNATQPLRPEARAAMAAALDVVGNPSSVHAEGRAARAVIERARAQVAEATGCAAGDVVFTSGATEAAALALAGRGLAGAPVEHDSVLGWIDPVLPVDADGRVAVAEPGGSVLQAANSETGVVQDLPAGLACVDAVQAVGRVPFAFDWSGARAAILSAHKLGGPKGVGALLLAPGAELAPILKGGGQEMGRRAGTENVAGIAGFGAAMAVAAAEVARGDLGGGGRDAEYSGGGSGIRGAGGYLCGQDCAQAAQHQLLRRGRMEGRDPGDAAGSRRDMPFPPARPAPAARSAPTGC